MGGTSRDDRKRQQEAAQRRLAAAGIRVPPKQATNRTPIVVVAVVLASALVVGAVLYFSRSSSGDAVAATYPVSRSGAVITVGTGPVVVDVYEDYLCPVCERFEERYGEDLATALNDGRITVRYHAIAILDEATKPAGYSTRAANAALCSVPAGVFPAFHEKLFDSQPAEGSAGLTDDQLTALGAEAGARGDFAGCVRAAADAGAIGSETEAAASNAALQTDGRFGTPTVAIDGRKIDVNDSDWLANAVAG